MQRKFLKLLALGLMLLLVACSSGNEHLIKGKWSLSGSMIAGSPTSFWFKWGGNVVAPWEKQNILMKSKGEYKFIDDTHISINMQSGYYNGNSYYFEIVKLDEKELVLQTNFQEIQMKRVEG